MRRISLLLLLAVAFIAGSLSLTSAVANDDHDDDSRDDSFSVTARSYQMREFDVGRDGPSLGDHFVFSDNLYQQGELVGYLDGECTVTRAETAAMNEMCVVTVTLPEGRLTSQGTIRIDEAFDDRFTIAITGGTEEYDDAGGQAHVRFLSETRTRIHVDLEDLD